jgi:GNAT superfamily N-acetyltransferase
VVGTQFTNDPGEFVGLAADFMQDDPFSTNVIGVHASGVIAGRRRNGPEDLWAVVSNGHRVVGVAMHTPPFNLFLSRMPVEAASQLAGGVDGLRRAIPGVTGEIAAASAFLDCWAELSGPLRSVDVVMRMYRLGQLRQPSGVPGHARAANRDDTGLLRDWLAAFQAETAPHGPMGDAAEIADRRIAAGEVTFWVEAKGPVSIAGCSAAANGIARVGPVYTPPAHRRHGYGAAATARATAEALEKGAVHVVLYTDLANSTSNSVYQSIGYVADHDAVDRRFLQK